MPKRNRNTKVHNPEYSKGVGETGRAYFKEGDSIESYSGGIFKHTDRTYIDPQKEGGYMDKKLYPNSKAAKNKRRI